MRLKRIKESLQWKTTVLHCKLLYCWPKARLKPCFSKLAFEHQIKILNCNTCIIDRVPDKHRDRLCNLKDIVINFNEFCWNTHSINSKYIKVDNNVLEITEPVS